jgi:acyl dehydratase
LPNASHYNRADAPRFENMALDYAKLQTGESVSSQSYLLDGDTVAAYAEAVGDRHELTSLDGGEVLAPPMAVAALSLKGVVNDLAIPGGTLHVGQELEFKRAVAVGETLDCNALLLQNSVRGEWRFLVVQLKVDDGDGHSVMEGKSTIMLPVQGISGTEA